MGPADWQVVIVHSERWAGMCAPLPATVLVDGAPPVSIAIRAREIRLPPPGHPHPLRLEQRERDLLCRRAAELDHTGFYEPTPGQHVRDEPWPGCARTILTIEPDPTVRRWTVR
jgi:hypothetical protein